ncbi:hypothetical protein NL676_017689 [Syzygium grande]|nr:hypothetical protein NL676_017689 [Syzygium grande]
MSSRVLILLGVLVACVLLFSSEVSARELAETTSKEDDAPSTATAETNDLNDAKYNGYGGYPGGGGSGGYRAGGTEDTWAAGDMEDTQVAVAMAVAMEVMDSAAPTVAMATDEDTAVVEVAGAALMLVRLLRPSQKRSLRTKRATTRPGIAYAIYVALAKDAENASYYDVVRYE